MEFHPIADEWPLMEGEPFSDLVASVRKHGVRVPCWKYEGKVLDGRNRIRAAQEAGVSVDGWHTFEGTEAEARELARLLNDDRRHLSKEDRAAWAAKLRAKGLSIRAIADAVGASPMTVHGDLKRGVHSCTPAPSLEPGTFIPTPASASSPESVPESVPEPEPPKVIGLDGKKYPAKRPEAKASNKTQEQPPVTAIEWSVFFANLAAIEEFTASISAQKLPEELQSWQLQQSLQKAARVMLAAAARLSQSR